MESILLQQKIRTNLNVQQQGMVYLSYYNTALQWNAMQQ